MEKSGYFEFSQRPRNALFVDGNYLLNITRALNIKLDVEAFFDDITQNSYRLRTYWFSAMESSLDRNNNAYRFLDRLRYIPRTKVYVGRMTKRSGGHYETALRTDAGISLSLSMLELAQTGRVDVISLIASDPEYTPAIRAVQKKGVLVKLIYPKDLPDHNLEVHPDLLKATDERESITATRLLEFEYISDYREDVVDEVTYDDDLDDGNLDDIDDIDQNLDDLENLDKNVDFDEDENLEETELILED